MALDIQFADRTQQPAQLVTRFQLREVPNGPVIDWLLPDVVLHPTDRLPHLSRVSVTVDGTPQVVAQRLQAAFFSKNFKPFKQVGQRVSIGGGRIANVGPLPRQVVCDLTVTVGYYDSDGKGHPIGDKFTVTRTCRLFSEGEALPSPELVVRPVQLTVTVDEPISLAIEVRHAPAGSAPALRLLYPDTLVEPKDPALSELIKVLPDLRSGLETVLGLTLQHQEETKGVTAFELVFALRLSQQGKNLLSTLREPVLIPLQTEFPGARPVQHLFRLECVQRQFPGWLVIDFGTSNSTVTVFDPRDLPPIEGLPQEQEARLCQLLAEFLSKDLVAEVLPGGRQFEQEWRDCATW